MKTQRTRIFVTVMAILLLLVLTACSQDHEHNFGSWRTDKKATCTQAGSQVRKCRCGEKETEEIPMLEHQYEQEVTAEASCKENGEATFTCSNCDDTYTETLDAKSYSSTEIYDMYLDSVGEIVVYDKKGVELGLGSCFVYTEDGQLITNYHVIEGAYSAKVTLGKKIYEIEKVLAYDKAIDIAILEISETGLTPANLCDKDHDVGEVVYAFGNSRGLTSTFSDGMITYSNREVDGVCYVQHDAPISGGNSGGPLINIHGEVIGINTWTVADSQNLNFAIHISELDNLASEEALTMPQFYDKERNAHKLIKDYTLAHSQEEDGLCLLVLDEYTSNDGSIYSISALCDKELDDIWLVADIDSAFYVYFIIDKNITGSYTWKYFDDYDNNMEGTLNAATFDGNTMLSYSYSNEYGEDLDLTRELSTVMMDYLCNKLDTVLADIGLTAEDLGFTHY